MKCPQCNEEMMILCRRDEEGFMNELYYKCLICGATPQYSLETQPKTKRAKSSMFSTAPLKSQKQPSKRGSLPWKIGTAAIIASLVLVTVMQIPVPVRVLATQVSIDPIKDILPYIALVNFTISRFSLNYTEGQMQLQVTADYASITTYETTENVTTCKVLLGKVLIGYKDPQRTLNMGFASLTMTVNIRYQELIAHIDLTAYMPLWTAILDWLSGRLP
ncbi:MAG: hypothetical protein QXP36_01460 [Conexivisphaerales archaeon]